MSDGNSQGSVRAIGAVFIAFAVAFNIPYTWLGMNFGYPGILRQPAGVVLTRFAEGGTPVILAWASFALAALLFAPLAVSHVSAQTVAASLRARSHLTQGVPAHQGAPRGPRRAPP